MVRYAVRKRHAHTAHVFWQQIKRGRTVIPQGVAEQRRQQDLLTAEEWQKTKRRMEHWCKTSAARYWCSKACTFFWKKLT